MLKKINSTILAVCFVSSLAFAQTEVTPVPATQKVTKKRTVKKVSVEGREQSTQVVDKKINPETPAAPEELDKAPKKTDEEIAAEESSKVQRTSEPEAAPMQQEVQTETKEEVVAEQTAPTAISEPSKHLSFMGELAPLSLWTPKVGGSVGFYILRDLVLEGSFMSGKFDGDNVGADAIEDIKEKRIDVVARFYTGKTFSIFAGYSMQETKVTVSKKTKADNPLLPFDDTTIDANGVVMGISSRWHWDSGFTFGVDWLSVFLPLSTSVDNDLRKEFGAFSDTQDYKDVEDGYDMIEDTPRVSILELGLGYTF